MAGCSTGATGAAGLVPGAPPRRNRERPGADSPGAFRPYGVRHIGVTVMLHATARRRHLLRTRGRATVRPHSPDTRPRLRRHPQGHARHRRTDDGRDHPQRPPRGLGAEPGDTDYEEIEYDLLEAAQLTGSAAPLSPGASAWSLPGVKRSGKWYVRRFDLVWHGALQRSRATCSPHRGFDHWFESGTAH